MDFGLLAVLGPGMTLCARNAGITSSANNSIDRRRLVACQITKRKLPDDVIDPVSASCDRRNARHRRGRAGNALADLNQRVAFRRPRMGLGAAA